MEKCFLILKKSFIDFGTRIEIPVLVVLGRELAEQKLQEFRENLDIDEYYDSVSFSYVEVDFQSK